MQELVEKLDGEEWERLLTRHYLRSDGPYGGTAITFLDATPAELVVVLGEKGTTPAAAQQSFLSTFSAIKTGRVLGGRHLVPKNYKEIEPGYFRYLVLTCLVPALELSGDSGAGYNFRSRLGGLLGQRKPFQQVSGVNALWRMLLKWCDHRHSLGEPIRRLKLPPEDPHMTLIGHSVHMAFPAWRDRKKFAQILTRIPPKVRRSPDRLSGELLRPVWEGDIPTPVRDACLEFRKRILRHERLLGSHRFWRLVLGVEEDLGRELGSAPPFDWILELRFSGYDDDIFEFQLVSQSSNGDAKIVSEGQFSRIITDAQKLHFDDLNSRLRSGILVFRGPSGGAWLLEGGRTNNDDYVTLVVRTELLKSLGLNTEWRSIDDSWKISRRIDPSSCVHLLRRLGMEALGEPELITPSIQNGISTGRGSYLGRPSLMPSIKASNASTMDIASIGDVEGGITLIGSAPEWQLNATSPVLGRWRLTASEDEAGSTDVDIQIAFEPNSPEHSRVKEIDLSDSRFDNEVELKCPAVSVQFDSSFLSYGPWNDSSPIVDLMESIYALGRGGWTEGKLLPLIQRVIPRTVSPWDVLRAFYEAGWLQPKVRTTWGARTWNLCSPRISKRSSNIAIIDGAICNVARERVSRNVIGNGGIFRALDGTSRWSPPTILVQGVDVDQLAADFEWPLTDPMYVNPVSAPRAPQCWGVETRTRLGRLLVGHWSFDEGRFVSSSTTFSHDGVRIERWRRERGDDRDLYLVVTGVTEFATTVRSVAIIEGYRQARRALFKWDGTTLRRCAKEGWLPIELVKRMRMEVLSTSGPHDLGPGAFDFKYSATATQVRWLRSILGPVIGASETVPSEPTGREFQLSLRRHRRGRNVWGTTQVGLRAVPTLSSPVDKI